MKIIIDDEDVFLNPDDLEVEDATLNEKLRTVAKKCGEYNMVYAKAQKNVGTAEDMLEAIEGATFDFYKQQGGSDKLVDAKVSANEQVIAAKQRVREEKYKAQLIFGHLRAMDKCHESTKELGYNIRKELDKIFPQEIKGLPQHNINDDVANLFKN